MTLKKVITEEKVEKFKVSTCDVGLQVADKDEVRGQVDQVGHWIETPWVER